MKYWKTPHIAKIYEALGAIGDGRVELAGDSARVYSSSRNKFYNVTYSPDDGAIMCNDNASYWNGTLGYPAIAYLLTVGVLEYKKDLADLLKGIAWKDINQKYKNDFAKALEHILSQIADTKRIELDEYADRLMQDIKNLKLAYLGEKTLPPEGY